MVTYPVAFTKLANSSLVTSVLSIQNPSTYTRCHGLESGICSSSAPIQNWPPGTQIIPEGAASGGRLSLIFGIQPGPAPAVIEAPVVIEAAAGNDPAAALTSRLAAPMPLSQYTPAPADVVA